MKLIYIIYLCSLMMAVGCQQQTESFSDVVLNTMPSIPNPTEQTPTSAPDHERNMIYQQFERGFMLWDVEKNCVYSFIDIEPERGIIIPDSLESTNGSDNRYAYCLYLPQKHVQDVIMTTTDTLKMPTGNMGMIWRAYPEIREGIGLATNDAKAFVAIFPRDKHPGFSCCYVGALPDGRVMRCGFYARSSGRCAVFYEDDED